MNTLVLLVIVIAFIFIVTYDPKKGKKIELYQGEPLKPTPHTCDEARYLEVQGLTGECTASPYRDIGGAIF